MCHETTGTLLTCPNLKASGPPGGSSPFASHLRRRLRSLLGARSLGCHRRGHVYVPVVCEAGRLKRDEGLVKEACSEGGPWDSRGGAVVCPFNPEGVCDRVEDGRL